MKAKSGETPVTTEGNTPAIPFKIKFSKAILLMAPHILYTGSGIFSGSRVTLGSKALVETIKVIICLF